ncbi:MAG: hypothetical protein WCC99_16065, partial [Candidatus Sulfotelmatobacter sp.]
PQIPTNRKIALAALKQFSNQPHAETGTFHQLYVFHVFTDIIADENLDGTGFPASSKYQKL